MQREKMAEVMTDFYNGAFTLEMLRGWAFAIAHPEQVATGLRLFEEGYAQLVQQRAEGKVEGGNADFSADTLELVKRLRGLLEPGLDNDQVRGAAEEIGSLAATVSERLRGKSAGL